MRNGFRPTNVGYSASSTPPSGKCNCGFDDDPRPNAFHREWCPARAPLPSSPPPPSDPLVECPECSGLKETSGPHGHERCEFCGGWGFVNESEVAPQRCDCHLHEQQVCDICQSATPSSPETRDIDDAIDRVIEASADREICEGNDDAKDRAHWDARLVAAKSALISIYVRQREEIALLTTRLSGHKQAGEEYRVSIAASSQLERLKAERLTAEEVNQITLYIPNGLQSWGITPSARQYWQALNEKLRLQSGGTTDV